MERSGCAALASTRAPMALVVAYPDTLGDQLPIGETRGRVVRKVST